MSSSNIIQLMLPLSCSTAIQQRNARPDARRSVKRLPTPCSRPVMPSPLGRPDTFTSQSRCAPQKRLSFPSCSTRRYSGVSARLRTKSRDPMRKISSWLPGGQRPSAGTCILCLLWNLRVDIRTAQRMKSSMLGRRSESPTS